VCCLKKNKSDILEFQMLLVELQHRPRAVGVNLLHRDDRLLAVLEQDKGRQLPGLIALNGLDLIDLSFPVVALRCPGAGLCFGTRGRFTVFLSSFWFWGVIRR
jgi:hypothetical protein